MKRTLKRDKRNQTKIERVRLRNNTEKMRGIIDQKREN